MKLGVMVVMNKNIEEEFKKLNDLEFSCCQLCSFQPELFTEENAELIKNSAQKYKIEITAFWCGWEGPAEWNFYGGPATLGLAPPAYRMQRMFTILKGAEFAREIGITDVITHMGFIPENPNDAEYNGLICTIRNIAQTLKSNGQYFLFETGQETPVTLVRAIQDIGTGNLGINLDPANLLLYGKANPVDALDIIGSYVRGVHAKDGEYPKSGRFLGEEKPLGQGKVNFPILIGKLKELGYNGALTIEREISGEQQIRDILSAKKLLESLIG